MSKRILLGHSLSLVLLALSVVSVQAQTPVDTQTPAPKRDGVSETTPAASTSGTIPVLDFDLGSTTLQTLDDNPGEVTGTVKVFQNHTTPLILNGNLELDLDLNQIRAFSTPTLEAGIEIKRRGSSSIHHPKKSYSLDFKNSVTFLGMPREKEWVLHSCWADKTCLRNVIGYWLAAKLFPWAPRTEFVEVFINGSYRGLYVAIEKIKHGPDRVNLPVPNDNPFNGISGAYILKRDGNDGDWDWQSFHDPNLKWWFVSPKRKNVSQAQKDYIRYHMDIYFEASFSPGSPAHDPWGYDEVMDERSAADFVIIQELANNVDAYWKSMHITKYPIYPGDDLVHMGPIWDLDLAFANYDDQRGNAVCETDQWRMDRAGHFQPLREMWKVGQFRRAIYDRWWALRNNRTISRSGIENQIDEFAARIANARARDDRKWKTFGKRTWWECWNKSTYQEEVAELKKWIRKRINWMDAQISNYSFVYP